MQTDAVYEALLPGKDYLQLIPSDEPDGEDMGFDALSEMMCATAVGMASVTHYPLLYFSS